MGKKASRKLIPKKIAGVKVPKAVRKGRFGELLASPAGQAMIAQAILGAGAVAAGLKAKDNPKVRESTHEAKEAAAGATSAAAGKAGAAGSTLAYALGEAARTFAEALQRRDEPAERQPDASAPARRPASRGPLEAAP